MGFAFSLSKEDDIKVHLGSLKEKHPKARHICYAFRWGMKGENFRYNDDGEPSGSAGRPIYNEILSSDLNYILVAVVRYFGGTKLGIPGLIHAYKTATKSTLEQGGRVKIIVTEKIRISCPIDTIGKLFNVLKQLKLKILETNYDAEPWVLTEVRKSQSRCIIKAILANFHGIRVSELSDDYVSSELTVKVSK